MNITTSPVPASLMASKATTKALRDALANHENLSERDREHVRAVADAERALKVAEAEETKQAAAAIGAGKPVPASKLDEQRRSLDAMGREGVAFELALRNSREAVEAAITANRPAWAKAHAGAVEQRRAAMRAALDAFLAAEEDVRAALAVDAFLAGRRQLRVGPLPLTRVNGEAYAPAELVDALMVYAAGDDADVERAKDAEQEAQAEANAGRADRDAEMLRWHVANGGSYGDPLYVIQDRYNDRGALRAA